MAKKVLNETLVTAITATLVGTESITSDGDAFNSNLPEGLTPETVEAVAGYTADFVAAGTEAIKGKALEAMKKDKKLTDVSGTIALGAMGSMSVDINKSREGTPPGSTEKQTYFGGNKVAVKFAPGESNSVLNSVRASIKTTFKDAFDKA